MSSKYFSKLTTLTSGKISFSRSLLFLLISTSVFFFSSCKDQGPVENTPPAAEKYSFSQISFPVFRSIVLECWPVTEGKAYASVYLDHEYRLFQLQDTVCTEVLIDGSTAGSVRLFVLDRDNIWLFRNTNSALYKLNGSKWNKLAELKGKAQNCYITSLCVDSPESIYGVGKMGELRSCIIHFDGTTLRQLPEFTLPNKEFQEIRKSSSDNLFIIHGKTFFLPRFPHSTGSHNELLVFNRKTLKRVFSEDYPDDTYSLFLHNLGREVYFSYMRTHYKWSHGRFVTWDFAHKLLSPLNSYYGIFSGKSKDDFLCNYTDCLIHYNRGTIDTLFRAPGGNFINRATSLGNSIYCTADNNIFLGKRIQ